jgi:hypothetical protein
MARFLPLFYPAARAYMTFSDVIVSPDRADRRGRSIASLKTHRASCRSLKGSVCRRIDNYSPSGLAA